MNTPETLSIVVPVFNEERSLRQIVDRLFEVDFGRAGVTREVIAIDDGSSDGSLDVLRELRERHGADLRVFSSGQNLGKGAALRIGFAAARGTIVTVQDADLEYDPNEFVDLLAPILAGEADVVYGSRYLRAADRPRNDVGLANRLGNGFLSLTTSVLFGTWLTDMETCYKVFRKSVVDAITLSSTGFEIEPELTVKFLRELRRRAGKLVELPITYAPRSKEGGKKIHYVKDGWIALCWLLSLRVSRGDAVGPWPIEALLSQAREQLDVEDEPGMSPAVAAAEMPVAAGSLASASASR